MKNPFRTIPASERRLILLERAEAELLEAQQCAEHWLAMEAMLERRVSRLRREADDSPKPLTLPRGSL